jgi:hypothetical protein
MTEGIDDRTPVDDSVWVQPQIFGGVLLASAKSMCPPVQFNSPSARQRRTFWLPVNMMLFQS